MASIEMTMPKMGESVMEGTILSWLKKVGDPIDEDESVLEVATDKVDTEIPSTHAGILKEILAQEGDVIQVGKPIAIIELLTDGDEPLTIRPTETPAPKEQKNVVDVDQAMDLKSPDTLLTNPQKNRFYSPLVRNIAKQEQIDLSELENIAGSGKDDRLTKQDVLNYLSSRNSQSGSVDGILESPIDNSPLTISGEDEIIAMDRMRKIIASRMIESKSISAHVTSFVEADMSPIVSWRNKFKEKFKATSGQSLTFTPIIIEAVVKAIKDHPMINIQVQGDQIIKKSHINIGVAVALPSGNLIVPVIKNAELLDLKSLVMAVNDLAHRARTNALKPDELDGGTFTVSNVGSFGNVMGTPIIMQPQVAIMAIGAIQKKPAVIETPEGDFIGIRHKMFLSHSYDHRVIDGSLGGGFVRRVADYLEKFDVNRSI
ncbi:MAG: dihydrolipoamide acetyltransferase family protein [Cytophagales bacterium]|jgi:2-oxoglutarate dehydrogenase E2 component (dihydrolipoamide succinyltransferase)|nr:2-oxo acid dehydrogenase subunit E2 [Cyclobacteriaceae bacterium]